MRNGVPGSEFRVRRSILGSVLGSGFAVLMFAVVSVGAQAPAPAPAPPAPAGRAGGAPPAYPPRPAPDPAAFERGKALYSLHCALCHGPDARGAQGPSLIRSEIVLRDQKGELIADVVRQGRPQRGMPALPLSAAEVSDVAAFVHAFPVGSRDPARNRPTSIVVGNATTGAATFAKKCGACHSVAGDLKGFGAKFTDARQLQTTWIMPPLGRTPVSSVPPATVTVTSANGQTVQGRLRRIDDFIVSVILDNGEERTIRRDGDSPKVELTDPLKPHRDLLASYTDTEIHDITAYLVTIK